MKNIRSFFRNNLQEKVLDLPGYDSIQEKLSQIESKIDSLVLAQAAVERRRVRSLQPGTPLAECEFKVYSQFGEDGILQHLVQHVPMAQYSFVEFGVEDFREANCRYLLEASPWHGLVLDGARDIDIRIRELPVSLLRNITSRSVFVTAENINSILEEEKFTGDIGVLSIDIDGNDYWIWKAIEVAKPRIVIIEYNSVFGKDRAVTIPYDPAFNRRTAHFSWLYAGASLPALVHLGEKKNYSFVGSNSAGNNAFFVRNDVKGKLKPLSVSEGYVESTFCESRDTLGNLSYLSGEDRLNIMKELQLIDVISGKSIKVDELL